jgi:hypothetical protein
LIFEADKHLMLIRDLAQLDGECLVDPALASMRVNRRPNCFACLIELRQAVPVRCRSVRNCLKRPRQGDLILTPASMRYLNRSLTPAAQVLVQWRLVTPNASLN